MVGGSGRAGGGVRWWVLALEEAQGSHGNGWAYSDFVESIFLEHLKPPIHALPCTVMDGQDGIDGYTWIVLRV